MSKEEIISAEDEITAAYDRIEELERERNEAVSAVQRLSSGQPFEAVVIADVVKRRTAAIERERDALQADNARLRETLQGIADADWRKWEELASPEEFVRWAQSRANHAMSATPEHSLARIRNQILDEAINVAWNHEPDCNGPIEMALRKLKEPE